MVRSKTIRVIKQLNKEEFHKLEKFLSSPYFNTNKNLIKLCKFLKKFHPGFTSAKFTKQNIFCHIYENEDYNDEKLRKLLSDMYKELEKFLVIIHLESDKTMYYKLLLKILDIKKLDKLFLSAFSDANGLLDTSGFYVDYFLEKFLLQWYYVTFHLDRGKQQKIARNIFERGNYGTLFYLSDLFRTLDDITANRNTFGFDYEPNLPEKFLKNFDVDLFFKYVDDSNITHKEIVKIYYYAYLANRNFEEEHYFRELENLTFNNWDKLSEWGQLSVIAYLTNYCTRKIMKGKDDFNLNLNKIYQIYLKHKLILREYGYVQSDVFLKILDNFFYVGKIEEVREELEKNIEHLHPDHKKEILCYYKALVNFSNKKYDEALEETTLIKTNSRLFINRLKLLQLKTYYELNLYDEARELANNYKKFVSNHRTMSEMVRNNRINFLNLFKGMLKIRSNNISGSIYELKKQMTENNSAEKKWLKEKIIEIESLTNHI